MDCQEFQRLAGPHRDGELDRELGRQLDEHANRCASCRQERQRLAALEKALDGALPASPFGDDFASRVARRAHTALPAMAAKAPDPAGGRRAHAGPGSALRPKVVRAGWRGPFALVAAAAGVLAALVIWSPWEKDRTSPPSGIAVAPAPGEGTGGEPRLVPPAPRALERSIALDDGSRIDLGDQAVFETQETGAGFEGILSGGWVRATVSPQPAGRTFTIRTPWAVAAVVGTQFELAYDPQREVTSVFVLEGKVRFGPAEEAKGALLLTAGT
ncbi:MAG: FecR domain-containing protein, partial [Planctomycetes bacterium]|nr:FecR domain-containing protein [Planctomycetota bacterium]